VCVGIASVAPSIHERRLAITVSAPPSMYPQAESEL
jgi:hypothetical protein